MLKLIIKRRSIYIAFVGHRKAVFKLGFSVDDILNASASNELAQKAGLLNNESGNKADIKQENTIKEHHQSRELYEELIDDTDFVEEEFFDIPSDKTKTNTSNAAKQMHGKVKASERIPKGSAYTDSDIYDADEEQKQKQLRQLKQQHINDGDDEEIDNDYDDSDEYDNDVDEDNYDYDENDDEYLDTDDADDIEQNNDNSSADDAELSDMIFDEGEYLSVPKIPEQYRASDIIGKRTQASTASTKLRIGPVKPKEELRRIWESLTDVEKYILMLISEHRHMTHAQLSVLIVTPSRLRIKKGAINNTKAYYEWVTKEKYGVKGMNYKNTFKTQTANGLSDKLEGLVQANLIERIVPAFSIDDRNISDRYKATPALFTEHYYLTVRGAKVLIANTDANKNESKEKPVGFVPTYKNSAYQTILHEAESTEVLCSIISCSSYATNPDDNKNYGLFDVCRFYHEKDIEEKNVVYKGKKIDFKTDGKLTVYVEEIGDFIDWYIEYDSGSSTKDKIKHKTEAFIKYIFWKREKYGEKFRKPVLLLVTQKPADLFPQLTGRQSTPYTTGIKNMAKNCFEEYLDILNDIAIVLVSDCGSIRTQGALGACWHRIDLVTGIADIKAYDLITASKGISRGLA